MRKIWKMGLVMVLGLGLAGCAWLFPPIEAVLTATPTSGTAPLSVTFSAAESTGDIVSFTLDFGDGRDPFEGTAANIEAAIGHEYANPGTYTAILTVLDNRGRTDTAQVTITVTAPPPPPPATSVSLGAIPASGLPPLAVNFFATITAAPGRRIKHLALDPDTAGPIAAQTLAVDFETFSGVLPFTSPHHTYTAPGTYTATLTVTDDATPAQVTTATVMITVTSPPPTITAFTANGLTDPQTVSSGSSVTFAFTAGAGHAGRRISRYTLSFGDTRSVTEEGLNVVHPADLTRTIGHTYTVTQTTSFTATLRVWDDLNNTDEESRVIAVTPPPTP